ncbi:hypothetical protein [Sulfitobacter sp. JL08]|nr:hypothetical protein [Sulfitobacter sp. JL08]
MITTTNAPWSGLNEKQCGWWIPLDQAQLTTTMELAMTRPRLDL